MQPLDIVFAGTPDFAARHLEALLASSHRVIAVYTQPDRKAGRGKKLQPGPVKVVAEKHGIPVIQPVSLKSPEAQAELQALRPDLLVVVAYGLILPRAVLAIPRLGCVNVHASLLPRWRGAAPIERALLAGDRETGVTIMQMDAGLDTGDMLLRRAVDISAKDTRITLEDKLTAAGIEALPEALDRIDELQQSAQPQQDEASTYAAKVEKSEALIDWQDTASRIDRQIRAGIGRQPAYSYLDDNRIRLLEAEPVIDERSDAAGVILEAGKQGMLVGCGQNCLLVTRVQLPGRNPVAVRDLLNAGQSLLRPEKQFSRHEPAP